MKLLTTEKQRDLEAAPRRIDTLRELNKRVELDADLSKELYRLNQGEMGERFVLECLQDFGLDHWMVVRNLWLEFYGKFEIDLLLRTKQKKYTFEIKNYNGHFEYRNGQCYLDGSLIGHNAISQAQKSSINFQSVLENENMNVKTQNVLVFTGEFCQVDVHDTVPNVDIVMRHQLRDYIRRIAKEERNGYAQSMNINQLTKMIDKYETFGPSFHEPIDEKILSSINKGILCSRCASFDIVHESLYVKCKCGMHEPIEMAFVRTVCEFSVIYGKRLVTTNEIYYFINKVFSEKTVRKYLVRYFPKIGISRGTKFLSTFDGFEEYKERCTFKRQSYLIL